MIKSQRTEDNRFSIKCIIMYGALGVLLFSALLFAVSMFCDKFQNVFLYRTYLSKLCLAGSALITGRLASKASKGKRLLNALAGESFLLLFICALGMVFGFPGGGISFLGNVGIMFFGAFAGTVSVHAKKKQRRGKR